MPKMKTKKAAAKRYHVTGTGKVRYKKQGLRHILTKKNAKRKRRLRLSAILSSVEKKRVKQLMPYCGQVLGAGMRLINVQRRSDPCRDLKTEHGGVNADTR